MNRIGLDGSYAAGDENLDWFVRDPEVDAAAHLLDGGAPADACLFGHTTYKMFDAFWPAVLDDPDANEHLRRTAEELTAMHKIVVSTEPRSFTWRNSESLKGDLVDAVRALKEEPGGTIMMFGSGTLVPHLAEAGLIDEYVLVVTPGVPANGRSLLASPTHRTFELLSAKSFGSGNVLLHYRD